MNFFYSLMRVIGAVFLVVFVMGAVFIGLCSVQELFN